ncbi:MAG: PD-(D/E)XK nuclease family protein [bacterium]|nr:PD-(D/E)XK nuclease family protein [bacterium]
MAEDKYKAVWVSHSSIGDFLKCPRLYYLRNVYKDPKTGRKIGVVNPFLSLGLAVHEVLEGLSEFKAPERFKQPLLENFEKAWGKVSGIKGGFQSLEEEMQAKERGVAMIERVKKNPGLLEEKTVRLKPSKNNMPPNFFLSSEDNIILCGKIDWLVYAPKDDSVKILDFKTGKNEEKDDSLQLPIYFLLLNALQKRKVSGAYYWYVDRDDAPKEVALPDLEKSRQSVLEIAKKIKEAREKNELGCPRAGCFACEPFEKIIRGEAKHVGVGEYQDLYLV